MRGMSVIIAMSLVILICLACLPVTATESVIVNGSVGSDNITSQALPVNDMPSEILIIHLDQPTFAVSLTPTQPITLDLVNHRIMMQLVDGSGNVIGAQSVTVSTT
jgi:ABC-type transport system involved in multi-copper enzyme maturation permease subunit